MKTPDLDKFYQSLVRHDWFYMMADDNTTYFAGVRAESALQSEAGQHPITQQMFDAFDDHRRAALGRRLHTAHPQRDQFPRNEDIAA